MPAQVSVGHPVLPGGDLRATGGRVQPASATLSVDSGAVARWSRVIRVGLSHRGHLVRKLFGGGDVPYPGVCRTVVSSAGGGSRRPSPRPVEPKAVEETLRVRRRLPTLASAGQYRYEMPGSNARGGSPPSESSTGPRQPSREFRSHGTLGQPAAAANRIAGMRPTRNG